ncbi:rod-binding protein [Sphingomonas sp.]|uniref:rod-binding protein n=1 Tax=Sphingomonas sp. TaxID=28214 RepID=UPI003AFF9194
MITGVSSTTTTPSLVSSSNSDAAGEKLKSAAQAFEAVFLRQMIGSMRQAGLGDGMFDSQATQQFQDMADSKTADSMSGKGVLGVAEMLVKQLSPMVPQVAAAGAAVEAGSRVAHVAGDLVSRLKL